MVAVEEVAPFCTVAGGKISQEGWSRKCNGGGGLICNASFAQLARSVI